MKCNVYDSFGRLIFKLAVFVKNICILQYYHYKYINYMFDYNSSIYFSNSCGEIPKIESYVVRDKIQMW